MPSFLNRAMCPCEVRMSHIGSFPCTTPYELSTNPIVAFAETIHFTTSSTLHTLPCQWSSFLVASWHQTSLQTTLTRTATLPLRSMTTRMESHRIRSPSSRWYYRLSSTTVCAQRSMLMPARSLPVLPVFAHDMPRLALVPCS